MYSQMRVLISEDNHTDQIEQQSTLGRPSEKDRSPRNWLVEVVSVIAAGYVFLSLTSPMFLKKEQQPPRRLETPDVVLVALVILFNSELLGRIVQLTISRSGFALSLDRLGK